MLERGKWYLGKGGRRKMAVGLRKAVGTIMLIGFAIAATWLIVAIKESFSLWLVFPLVALIVLVCTTTLYYIYKKLDII